MSAIIEQLQFTGQKSWLPRLISLLIVLFFLWWAASRIMSYFEDDKAITIAKQNAVEIIPTKPNPSLDQLNLFGASQQELAKKKTAAAKITNLRFTLKGILATSDPKQGAVQIQNASHQESNFTVGQSVFGEATLDEIYPDRVILYLNGQYETLMLPGKSLNSEYFLIAKSKTGHIKNTPVLNRPEKSQTTKSTQAVFMPQVIPQAGTQQTKQTTTNKLKTSNDYRTISISGSGEILRDLFIFNTAWKQGNFIGFIIKARGKEGLKMMDVLGIKNHDLITVVNGLRFSEELESPEQLEQLKKATSIDAIFERDGKEIPFHFDFENPLANLGS